MVASKRQDQATGRGVLAPVVKTIPINTRQFPFSNGVCLPARFLRLCPALYDPFVRYQHEFQSHGDSFRLRHELLNCSMDQRMELRLDLQGGNLARCVLRRVDTTPMCLNRLTCDMS